MHLKIEASDHCKDEKELIGFLRRGFMNPEMFHSQIATLEINGIKFNLRFSGDLEIFENSPEMFPKNVAKFRLETIY